MGLLSRFDSSKRADNTVAEIVTPAVDEKRGSGELDIKPTTNPDVISFGKKQTGVKKVEAITKVWTKWHLIAAYSMYVSFERAAPEVELMTSLTVFG